MDPVSSKYRLHRAPTKPCNLATTWCHELRGVKRQAFLLGMLSDDQGDAEGPFLAAKALFFSERGKVFL
ncbi:hypothetical protein [Candidatus Palauibacter sp.]|uniref:hypothetical protein n=1 Tax=Candidatus Palauibacter sp. TaxID=3101350 RepID=UPI003B02C46A